MPLKTKITLVMVLLVLAVVGVTSLLYLRTLTQQVIRQADANRLAAVLENVDVAHIREPAKGLGPVAPYLDEVLDVFLRLLAERRVVLGCVADDLAASVLARE